MTTTSLQSLHHNHHHSILKRHPVLASPDTPSYLKLYSTITTISLSSSSSSSSTTSFSLSPTTSTSPPPTTFDQLQHYLATQNFRQADEETRRLLIQLAGEPAQKRGYIFFSEVQFIPEPDLKAIDELWKQHSNNRFGYSIQKKIFGVKSKKDFTRFFIKVGWMKKLDTEVEQYNYRAFPNEFIWELDDVTPEGHLPLTNALRGTQLLNSIFDHPAFKHVEQEEEEGEVEVREFDRNAVMGSNPLNKKVFKTDYSF